MLSEKKNKILVIEDTINVLEELRDILTFEEFEVITAKNGEEGILKAKLMNPDLILCDIMMPVKNGYELCRELKSDDATKEIPIILLTAKFDSDSIAKGFDAGAHDYITKPFNIAELLARVNTHLNLKLQNDKVRKYANELEQKKNVIEEKNRELNDSIRYAKNTQDALLPDLDLFQKLLPQSFIFNKPRDVVSGDFYWISEIKQTNEKGHNNKKLLVVSADCTGHGVPGALLTMLGIGILHRFADYNEILNAAQLLTYLDSELTSLIADSSKKTRSHDGMEIAICMIDFEEMTLEFSGAGRPLFLVRNKELISCKGSIFSIGANELLPEGMVKDFFNTELKIQKNDMIYLFSDGFVDQFGGENDKRFSTKRFKSLLLNISDKSMKEQKKSIETAFLSWKAGTEQVDDILVMGIKI